MIQADHGAQLINKRTGMGARVVSFTLYIVKWGNVDHWSRYIAGLRECVRACDHHLPGYTVALMLADDVEATLIEMHPNWAKVLRMVTEHPSVTVHRFKMEQIAKATDLHHYITPLYARFKVLALYPDADVVAIRDADSPPTQADAAAIEYWRITCASERPFLTYALPLWGAPRIGGGMTFHKPGTHCELDFLDNLPQIKSLYEGCGDNGWGFDEFVADEIIPPKPKWCTIDSFHDPDLFIYFTGLDFRIPLIDRIDSRCSDECYYAIAMGKCRAVPAADGSKRTWKCECPCGVQVYHDYDVPKVAAVATPDHERIILYEDAADNSVKQGIYSAYKTYPSAKRVQRLCKQK